MTHTKREKNPWWQVELAESEPIGDVTVWSRTDCCANRLSNFWIFVSDKPFTTNDLGALKNDPAVESTKITSAPSPSTTVNFAGAQGQYVRVQIEGTQYLSLAEVEVARYSGPDSFPHATQSSTGYGGDASRAIDGNVDGIYRNGSITHTHPSDKEPWLNIELSGDGDLRAVEVWHRTDCCTDRNNVFTVKVSLTNANACTQGADYEKEVHRIIKRANNPDVAPDV